MGPGSEMLGPLHAGRFTHDLASCRRLPEVEDLPIIGMYPLSGISYQLAIDYPERTAAAERRAAHPPARRGTVRLAPSGPHRPVPRAVEETFFFGAATPSDGVLCDLISPSTLDINGPGSIAKHRLMISPRCRPSPPRVYHKIAQRATSDISQQRPDCAGSFLRMMFQHTPRPGGISWLTAWAPDASSSFHKTYGGDASTSASGWLLKAMVPPASPPHGDQPAGWRGWCCACSADGDQHQ